MATPSKLREFWDWGRALIEALTALRNAFGCCEFALVDRDWDGDPIGLYCAQQDASSLALKIAGLCDAMPSAGAPTAKLELVGTEHETNAAYAGPAAAMIVAADIVLAAADSIIRAFVDETTDRDFYSRAAEQLRRLIVRLKNCLAGMECDGRLRLELKPLFRERLAQQLGGVEQTVADVGGERPADEQEPKVAAPGTSNEVQQGAGKTRPRITKEEANIRAREALKASNDWSVRKLAKTIGCSDGLANDLPAWKAWLEERRPSGEPAPKAIRATDKLLDGIGEPDAQLQLLIGEQQADQKADSRGYRRRAKV